MRQGQIFCRDHDLDERTGLGPGHAQLASELLDSLPHPANPHPDAAGPELHYALFDSLAIVAYCDRELTVQLLKSDPAILGTRMAEDVVERLLNDAEGCGFYLRGKSGKLSRLHIQKSFDATAFRKPFQKPAQRGQQSNFVEQRRMQKVGDAAHLLDC